MHKQVIAILLIGFLISACAAPVIQSTATLEPSQTPRPTSTPTRTPTITPSPTPDVRLGPYWEEVRVWNNGTYSVFRISRISETFRKTQLYGVGWIEPAEGFKIIEVVYEYEECPFAVEPVLMDENGVRYLEGYTITGAQFSINEGERIRTSNCSQWVFGVPAEGNEFTLLLPIKKSENDTTSFYELDVDDALYPVPAPINCLADSIGLNSIVISWEIPDGLEGDEQIWLSYSAEWIGPYSLDHTQYLINGLEPATLYYIEVIIENEQERQSSCSLVVTTLTD